jgi:hypothetical protein
MACVTPPHPVRGKVHARGLRVSPSASVLVETRGLPGTRAITRDCA